MAKGDLTIVLDESDYRTLQSMLDKLSKVDQANAVQSPLRQGANMIIKAGKANLKSLNKEKTGNLKKSFAVKVNKSRAAAYAGFRRSAPTKGIIGGNHAHLVDRGTTERWTIYNHPILGRYRGYVSKDNPNKGSMFWTDAVTQNGDKVMENITDGIYNEISKIMSRR